MGSGGGSGGGWWWWFVGIVTKNRNDEWLSRGKVLRPDMRTYVYLR